MKPPLLADPRLWSWLAIAVVIGWLVYVLSPILAPFLAGAILAYVLNPLVGRLTGRYLPRTVAAVLVLAACSGASAPVVPTTAPAAMRPEPTRRRTEVIHTKEVIPGARGGT